jgi:hypothetical protein
MNDHRIPLTQADYQAINASLAEIKSRLSDAGDLLAAMHIDHALQCLDPETRSTSRPPLRPDRSNTACTAVVARPSVSNGAASPMTASRPMLAGERFPVGPGLGWNAVGRSQAMLRTFYLATMKRRRGASGASRPLAAPSKAPDLRAARQQSTTLATSPGNLTGKPSAREGMNTTPRGTVATHLSTELPPAVGARTTRKMEVPLRCAPVRRPLNRGLRFSSSRRKARR